MEKFASLVNKLASFHWQTFNVWFECGDPSNNNVQIRSWLWVLGSLKVMRRPRFLPIMRSCQSPFKVAGREMFGRNSGKLGHKLLKSSTDWLKIAQGWKKIFPRGVCSVQTNFDNILWEWRLRFTKLFSPTLCMYIPLSKEIPRDAK